MAASVIIQEHTSSASATDKTSGSVRFKNENNSTVDTNDPLVVPSSGQEFSYEKWLQVRITSAAPTDVINNLEFYTDGSNGLGTGVKLWANASATFRPPAIPDESNATPLGGNPSATMVDAFSYTANSALSLGAGDFSGSSTNIGSFAVLVMEVESAAGPGATNTETITFSYDEI